MASNPIVKLGNKFINLPGGLAKSAVQLGKLRESSALGTPFAIPTALDNMDASNPGLKSLAALPIAPGALYRPSAEMFPALELIDHVTPVFDVFCTVAANPCDWL